MSSIQKAGAIILSKDDPKKIAVLYRSKEKDWSIPKGHIKNGESAKEATCREALEETGLTVRFIKELPSLEYDHPKGDHVIMRVFLARSEDDTKLKKESSGDDIKWLPYSEVSDRFSYKNLKQYFIKIREEIRTAVKNVQS